MRPGEELFFLLALGVLALAAISAAAVAFRPKPASLLAIWLLIMFAIPYWLGLQLTWFVPLLVPTAVLIILSQWGRGSGVVHSADGLLVFCTLALLILVVAGRVRSYDAAVLAGQWLLPYMAGRLLFTEIHLMKAFRLIAAFGVALGAVAIIEFVADWHPFTSLVLDNYASKSWSWIQYRAGLPRSEWSFGHSIALGNVIAMTVPFIAFANWTTKSKAVAIIVAAGGVGCTFSRNAAAAFALSLVVIAVLRPSHRSAVRWGVLISAYVAAVAGMALASTVVGSEGSELAQSTESRIRLLRALESVRFFGNSGTFIMLRDGNPGYLSDDVPGRVVRSVDNAFALLALNAGWLVTLLFASVIVVACAKVSPSNPAAVAVLTQIPTLFTVALITQYASFFWLVVGAAISISFRSNVTKDGLSADGGWDSSTPGGGRKRSSSTPSVLPSAAEGLR